MVTAGNWIIGVRAANWNPRAISRHSHHVVAPLRTAGEAVSSSRGRVDP